MINKLVRMSPSSSLFTLACALLALVSAGAMAQSGLLDTSHSWVASNISLELPENVVFAGQDPDGYKIYVGRLQRTNYGVYPAKIKVPTGALYLTEKTVYFRVTGYDVLVASHDREYAWVRSYDGHLERRAVAVGTSGNGDRVYICRVILDDGVVMGNLYSSARVCAAKHLNYMEADKYEVLVEM